MNLPINIKNLVFFPMKKEETDKTPAEYGTPLSFKDRFMSYNASAKSSSASINGDGATTNTYFAKNGGELTLNIQKLRGEERVVVFGETKENDGSISSGSTDLIPYVAVIFTVENDDGTVDLRKYPKVKLIEQPESGEQKGENGVKYSTAVLKGNYMDIKDKQRSRYICEDIDERTEEGKRKIADWYADGNPFSKVEATGDTETTDPEGTETTDPEDTE